MSDSNGTCSADGSRSCQMMLKAITGAHDKDRTGLVQGLFPPHVVAVRIKGPTRGNYANLILRLCPWCGADLPQGGQ